ncbi:MAG: hypothetical protein F4Z31_16500 [Gemmatimonadetes bacterium]|nr:hypothetical protein [Gemmatimonadota bacterium]MYE94094.1 hypothetical protein [Gemmatimonadota bacterium]
MAKGAATITVTATDTDSAAARQAFAVTVPNRPPEPVDSINAVTVAVDSATTVDATDYFADPDGDGLAYAASSSDSSRVTVSVAGSKVTLAGVAKGAATITVTATDTDSAAARQAFAVSVPNRPPATVVSIPAVTVADKTAVVDVANWFADPDEEPLLYTARSMDTTVLRIAAISGSVVHLARGGAGKVGLEATATDSGGLSAYATVVVTVSRDREVLEALYRAAGGLNWERSGNWLTNTPLREWQRVEVDSAGRVRSLDLRANRLRGPIPPDIGDLTALEELYLQGNYLTGPIPSEIGHLAALQVLDLRSNRLTDPIPPEIGDLAALEVLDLSHNRLTGPIPSEIGNLAALKGLNLSSNPGLTGPIPSEIGNLVALEYLSLRSFPLRQQSGSGALGGPIPPEIGNLAALQVLDLGRNRLTGPIPREIGRLVSLKRLYLDNNWLVGPIPREIGDLAALEYLWLHRNSLGGPIPTEMAHLTAMKEAPYLSRNPDLCAPDSPRLLAWFAALGIDWSSGRCALLGGYHRKALEKLYRVTGGASWKRSDNWLTDAPLSEWYGVKADSVGLVVSVKLSDNGLRGSIPFEIDNLAATLEVLDLSDNALTGPIPSNPPFGSMLNLAARLKELDLAGNSGLCTPDYPWLLAWLAALKVNLPRCL